jgi:hypothetical protein
MNQPKSEEAAEETFIDIHIHTRAIVGFPRRGEQAYARPAQVIERLDELDIERAVILPRVSPECSYSLQTVEEALDICRRHPDRFLTFCNVDPRELTNAPDAPFDELLAYYKQQGALGVGELAANLRFDDPRVDNLFHHAEAAGLPVTFHVAPRIGGCYGLFDEPGLPLLERALDAFPRLVFLGHSQPFWAEIGPVNPAERNGYPEGPVEREGRVVELMRRYPNLHGDLSANSGYNAVHRDEAFGGWFLEEFEDRLYFGTDLVSPGGGTPLGGYLKQLRDDGKISPECFDKVARTNAERLLGL